MTPVPVVVHVAEALRRYAAAGPIPVTGRTVAEALASLFQRFPDLRSRTLNPAGGEMWPYLVLFRNGQALERRTALDTALVAGDEIEIVAAAEGGGSDPRDVRMRGFRERTSLQDAVRIALDGAEPCGIEAVTLAAAAGRILAEDVISSADVPPFPRSAMDGYAVRAEDTFGATVHDPVSLELTGESMPGAEPTAVGGAGRAVRIMTGAPIPAGADAVVPAEHATERDGRVWVEAPTTPSKNVGRIGEDVKKGERVLVRGRRLRPQDVGLLASVGIARPAVVRQPRVAILANGNELLPPGVTPFGHRIADSNTPMLQGLLDRDGGSCVAALRLGDDAKEIRDVVAQLADEGTDVLLATGGTSVGREDHLPMIVRSLGTLPVHGVAMRPSAPTGIGRVGAMRVFLLPGNPVSCLAAYDVFASPVVRALAGLGAESPYRVVRLRLAGSIASQVGRTDYCRVAVAGGRAEPIAISGASILMSTVRGDGFVLVPESSEGYAEGAEVDVFLYDEGRRP